MPVGTQATVKGLTPDQLRATGTRMLLANTYHLALRPGEEVVAALGGLHAFMGWDGPILTDSGGFQVFSLADRNRVTDQGVTFRSHLDGRLLELTPERATAIQEALGADVAMCLDHCPPLPASTAEIADAVRRTIAWADALQGGPRAAPIRPSSASFRGDRMPTSAPSAPTPCWLSTSTATPSAASASARTAISFARRSPSRPTSCPTTGRAT